MTTLALVYSSAQKRVQEKINSAVFLGFNWRIICILGFFMACFLLVFYTFLVINLTGGTYLIKSYKNDIEKLTQENKNLEVSFAETGFMDTVDQKAEALSFEKTKSVKYIQILDSSLARAK